ncbi:hypothetical protein COOONC_04644 [Cooperia oncophora]
MRIQNEGAGKSSWWVINPDAKPGRNPRRVRASTLDTTSKNSIRHNLSLHSRFMRIQNEGAGKSSWWVINPDAKPGRNPRRVRASTLDTTSKRLGKSDRRCFSSSTMKLNLHAKWVAWRERRACAIRHNFTAVTPPKALCQAAAAREPVQRSKAREWQLSHDE